MKKLLLLLMLSNNVFAVPNCIETEQKLDLTVLFETLEAKTITKYHYTMCFMQNHNEIFFDLLMDAKITYEEKIILLLKHVETKNCYFAYNQYSSCEMAHEKMSKIFVPFFNTLCNKMKLSITLKEKTKKDSYLPKQFKRMEAILNNSSVSIEMKKLAFLIVCHDLKIAEKEHTLFQALLKTNAIPNYEMFDYILQNWFTKKDQNQHSDLLTIFNNFFNHLPLNFLSICIFSTYYPSTDVYNFYQRYYNEKQQKFTSNRFTLEEFKKQMEKCIFDLRSQEQNENQDINLPSSDSFDEIIKYAKIELRSTMNML